MRNGYVTLHRGASTHGQPGPKPLRHGAPNPTGNRGNLSLQPPAKRGRARRLDTTTPNCFPGRRLSRAQQQRRRRRRSYLGPISSTLLVNIMFLQQQEPEAD
ncbi:unnamed protein product [Urochloa humidicola]